MKEIGIALFIMFSVAALACIAENVIFDGRVRAIEAEMKLD